MTCTTCGRHRIAHGFDYGAPAGSYLAESSCHDGVWMDDDVHAEGWRRDVIYRPCPNNPRACRECGGTGDADPGAARDDCAVCRGTGWQGGKPEWPIVAEGTAATGGDRG